MTTEKVAVKTDRPEQKKHSAQANEAFFFELMKRKLNDSAFEYIVSICLHITVFSFNVIIRIFVLQVRYHGKEVINGEPCLVLEYLEGGDLSKFKPKSKDKERLVRLWIRFGSPIKISLSSILY